MRDINTSFVKNEDELKEFISNTPYSSDDGSYDIDDHINEVNDAIRWIDDELTMLRKAADVMSWYDITYNVDEYKDMVLQLTNKKNDLFMYSVNVKSLLYEKQRVCGHDEKFVRYIGYDHGHEYHICDNCGKDFKD